MLTALAFPAMSTTSGSTFRTAGGVVFGGFLFLAAAYDIRTRRVPNWLVAGLAVLGLAFSAITAPATATWTVGLAGGIKGLLMGLAIWLPSWLLRLLGAGDVKFFAAASAWLGARGAFVGSVLAALAGGLLALGWMLWYRGLRGSALTLWAATVHPRSLIQPVSEASPTPAVPYAPAVPYTVALAFGAAWVSWIHRLFV